MAVFARRHAIRFVNVVVFVALAGLLYTQVDVREMRRAIRGADLALIGAAFAINLPVAALFAIRSHFVLGRLGHRVEARVLIPAMILGNVAGSLTPASTGELLRAAALRSHANIPAPDGIALVLFERGLSLYLLALGTGVIAAFVALSHVTALVVGAASIPMFAAPVVAPAILRLLPAPSDTQRTSLAARLVGQVHDATGQLRWILEDRPLLAIWSLATSLLFAMFTIQIWLLARSVSHVVDPAQVWVAFGASQLAGIASLLPFGVGAMDGSLAAILRKFGLTIEQGTATAILFRLVVTIPYGAIALFCYVYLQRLDRAEPTPVIDASA